MKQILLPTDFSNNSWNAIRYALQLFKNQKCNFILINTYTPIVYNLKFTHVSSTQFVVEDSMKDLSIEGLDTLQKKIDTDFKNSNHTFSYESVFNSLTNEINKRCVDDNIDMIIMGTQGASGVKEILFGSNTMHIVSSTNCPVLAIPNDFRFEAPHEILFPSDYNVDFQKKQIQHILNIANLFNARINVMHVFYGNKLTEKQEFNKQKLNTYLKKTAHLFHDIKNKNIPEAIAEFQLKARINLLVMLNNKHSFFENLFFKSNIKHLGFHLNIPFLVIPSKT